MPRKTDGEKIDELEKTVAALIERSENDDARIARLTEDVEKAQQAERSAAQALNDLRRDHDREIALLKRELEEQRKWTEKNGVGELKTEIGLLKEKVAKLEAANERGGNRAWSVVPNILGAIVSSGIAAVVAFLVARR